MSDCSRTLEILISEGVEGVSGVLLIDRSCIALLGFVDDRRGSLVEGMKEFSDSWFDACT